MNLINGQRHETAVALRLAANEMQSEYLACLPEEAKVYLFHVSPSIKSTKTINYDKERINGFTILVVEQEGTYFFQASICHKEDDFDRNEGRRVLFSKLLADKNDFDLIEVPSTAFEYYPENRSRRAVIDYFIRTYINKNKRKEKQGLAGWKPLLQKELVQRLEETIRYKLTPFLPVDSRLIYQYSEDKTVTTLKVVPASNRLFTDDNHKADVLEQLEIFTTSTKQSPKDSPNRYIGRFICLKKLNEKLNK